MALPTYFTGTVQIANQGTLVTGTGCMWSGINAREGDYFTRADGVSIITEVIDATHLKITPWPGATVSGGDYAIQQNYVGRVVGVAAAEAVGVMLEKLHTDGLPFIVGDDEVVPDPSYGDEGQLAFKPVTGQWWVKQGGVWVPSFGLSALGYGGTSATPISVGLGTKVFTTQSSLAYAGARVHAASAANLNNWMEGPASYSGTTLTIAVDLFNGAGTSADWLFSIAGQRGQTGPPGPAGGTFADAPNDGTLYGRKAPTPGGVVAWAPASGGGGGASVLVGTVAPAGAADNSLWLETDTGLMFIKYNDGTSSQWVAIGGSGGIADAPFDGALYGRINGTWTAIGGGTVVEQHITGGGLVAINNATTIARVDQAAGAPITLTMGPASAKTAPVMIIDWKGDASLNNITVTLTAPDKFPGGLTSWVIAADTGSLMLRPIAGVGYAL